MPPLLFYLGPGRSLRHGDGLFVADSRRRRPTGVSPPPPHISHPTNTATHPHPSGSSRRFTNKLKSVPRTLRVCCPRRAACSSVSWGRRCAGSYGTFAAKGGGATPGRRTRCLAAWLARRTGWTPGTISLFHYSEVRNRTSSATDAVGYIRAAGPGQEVSLRAGCPARWNGYLSAVRAHETSGTDYMRVPPAAVSAPITHGEAGAPAACVAAFTPTG